MTGRNISERLHTAVTLTIGSYLFNSLIESDVANEQPEQAGFRWNRPETTRREQQNPRRSRGSSGANKNRTCDLILIRDAL